MILRFTFILLITALSAPALSHHWVSEDYNEHSLVTVEVVVQAFRFINPHPFVSVVLPDSDDLTDVWTLEMDNRWELAALGFTEETLSPGDLIQISANPSPYDNRALYVRSIEHPRLNFRYEHNVRQLFELESE